LDLKECALRLWDLGWEREEICFALLISQASLYRWAAIFDEHESPNRPPSPLIGRPGIITRAILNMIHMISVQNPDTYLIEIQFWLAVHQGIRISLSALKYNLDKAGLTRKMLHKIARERDEALRAEWKLMVNTEFTGSGEEFIFVDETSKNDLDTARRYGYSVVGERADFTDFFQHGIRYSVACALDVTGTIAARAIEGSFTGITFYEYIVEEVVSICACFAKDRYPLSISKLPMMTPWPGPRSVLVLDNCPIHHNDALLALMQAAGNHLVLLYICTTCLFECLKAVYCSIFRRTRLT
jgi:transposase